MRKQFVTIMAAVLLMVSYAAAQNVSPAELQFREALHKQQVEGDLTNAIKIYQSIVASKTADRAVKAKALLQLAACYEKLGQKSEAVYQQIVHEFADQPAATQARAKLAALKPPVSPTTMTMRKIEMAEGIENVVATDGQRVVYLDSSYTTLYIGDVAGKDKRVIHQAKRPLRAVVSRDLSSVFFYFPPSPQEIGHYAVMKADGTGFRDIVLRLNGEKLETKTPAFLSWSWDNRYILMCYLSEGGTHLLKTSVMDGTTQDVLERNVMGLITAAQFSPDGRFIAYQEFGTFTTAFAGPVRIVPAQGGEPRLISENARLGGWSRDGRYLVLAKTDSDSLQGAAVPIRNGQPSGEPITVRTTIPGVPYIMANGTIIVGTAAFRNDEFFVGALDAQDHLIRWEPLKLPASNAAYPTWAPDGRRIAYVARGPGDLGVQVRVRDIVSGSDRELYHTSENLFMCIWAHQHPLLYCNLQDGKVLSIALDSGNTEKVGTLDGLRTLLRLSADDRFLLGVKQASRAEYEWEIGTDRERTVRNVISSDDGRWSLDIRTPDAENRRQMRIRPTAGAENDWKVVAHFRGSAAAVLGPLPLKFTPDGNWIFYHDKENGKDGFYRVSTTDGEPERVGDYPTSNPSSWLTVSPDGRQFVVEVPGPMRRPEFWAMENFIPTTTKAVTK